MLKTENLTKKYGDVFAIKSIDLNLEQGDLFGFIGPNGAGKTTTMRIISTLLEPSWGEAYVCGHAVQLQPKEIRRLVGYMPDFFGVYDGLLGGVGQVSLRQKHHRKACERQQRDGNEVAYGAQRMLAGAPGPHSKDVTGLSLT